MNIKSFEVKIQGPLCGLLQKRAPLPLSHHQSIDAPLVSSSAPQWAFQGGYPHLPSEETEIQNSCKRCQSHTSSKRYSLQLEPEVKVLSAINLAHPWDSFFFHLCVHSFNRRLGSSFKTKETGNWRMFSFPSPGKIETFSMETVTFCLCSKITSVISLSSLSLFAAQKFLKIPPSLWLVPCFFPAPFLGSNFTDLSVLNDTSQANGFSGPAYKPFFPCTRVHILPIIRVWTQLSWPGFCCLTCHTTSAYTALSTTVPLTFFMALTTT